MSSQGVFHARSYTARIPSDRPQGTTATCVTLNICSAQEARIAVSPACVMSEQQLHKTGPPPRQSVARLQERRRWKPTDESSSKTNEHMRVLICSLSATHEGCSLTHL